MTAFGERLQKSDILIDFTLPNAGVANFHYNVNEFDP